MEQGRLLQAMRYFGAPERFCEAAGQMVQEVEWELILLMKEDVVTDRQLRSLVTGKGLAVDPVSFLRISYQRGIIDKVPEAPEPSWRVGTFYRRFSYFAQYEFYAYTKLPRETQVALNEWQFSQYLATYSDDVRAKMRGEDTRIHNSDFLTLEEAFAFVDKHPDSIYLHACNCKSQQYYLHDKPICVCMMFYDGPNGEPDRGYGEKLTVEQAKAKLREFNKKGLMQSGESLAVCNCDGEACCPIQMGKILGSRGMYPKAHYDIDWHPEECINCGRCTQICNFGAFQKDKDGLVMYDKELCWGCTICAANCPKGAIQLVPKGA